MHCQKYNNVMWWLVNVQIESLIFQFTSPQYTAFNIDKNKSTRCYLCVRQSNSYCLYSENRFYIIFICIYLPTKSTYIRYALSLPRKAAFTRQYAYNQRHSYDRRHHTHAKHIYLSIYHTLNMAFMQYTPINQWMEPYILLAL